MKPRHLGDIQRAFYALCTHIDHQFRVVLGTLREEGLLDNTAILFTGDHGDMLGTHGLWAKRVFYEESARVPTILLGPAGDRRTPPGTVDGRLVQLADVMPTLLGFAGVTVPEPVEGLAPAWRNGLLSVVLKWGSAQGALLPFPLLHLFIPPRLTSAMQRGWTNLACRWRSALAL